MGGRKMEASKTPDAGWSLKHDHMPACIILVGRVEELEVKKGKQLQGIKADSKTGPDVAWFLRIGVVNRGQRTAPRDRKARPNSLSRTAKPLSRLHYSTYKPLHCE